MGNIYSTITEEAKLFKELTSSSSSDNNSSGQQTPLSSPSCSNDGGKNAQQQNLKLKGAAAPFFDPRSPSQGVHRTPLEIEERNRRIEKARITNLFNNKENNLLLTVEGGGGEQQQLPIVTTPTGPSLNKDGITTSTGFIDPRSPNPEINRTPIGFSSSKEGGGGGVGRKKIQMFQN